MLFNAVLFSKTKCVSSRGAHMYVYACGGQSLMWVVFFNHSLPYTLRKIFYFKTGMC